MNVEDCYAMRQVKLMLLEFRKHINNLPEIFDFGMVFILPFFGASTFGQCYYVINSVLPFYRNLYFIRNCYVIKKKKKQSKG